MFTDAQKAALAGPLDPKHVKSRAQAGRQLSYIEGWVAIAEANRIFGFDAWDRETVELRQLGEPYQTPQVDSNGNAKKDRDGNPLMNWRVAYMARVRITVHTPVSAEGNWATIIRDGCGYGSGIDRDIGQAHESALKEAETDAMKRAFMTFGNPLGLALYDKSQANVASAPPPSRPIPPEVARSPDAPSDIDKRMADSLIAAGRQAQSNEELDLWWKLDSTQAVFRDLPAVEQERVKAALKEHRMSLRRAA